MDSDRDLRAQENCILSGAMANLAAEIELCWVGFRRDEQRRVFARYQSLLKMQ